MKRVEKAAARYAVLWEGVLGEMRLSVKKGQRLSFLWVDGG